jgi:hypothetical protein
MFEEDIPMKFLTKSCVKSTQEDDKTSLVLVQGMLVLQILTIIALAVHDDYNRTHPNITPPEHTYTARF